MKTAWNDVTAFFRIMEQGGSYYGLGLLAVLFCLVNQRTITKRERWSAILFFLITALLYGPWTVLLYERFFGQSYPFGNVSLIVPLLPFLAGVGALLVSAGAEKKMQRPVLTVGLVLVIMAAGTIVPFGDREDLGKSSQITYGRDEPMVQAVLEGAACMEQEGEVPLLAAPKEIMDCIRRYDGNIRLAYGRDLWQTGALTYLHEQYSEEQIVLCQQMESEGANAAKTVELALEQGCNMIVCRETLSDSFTAYHGLSLYAQTEELYLYLRR